jgi:hypothetical protein
VGYLELRETAIEISGSKSTASERGPQRRWERQQQQMTTPFLFPVVRTLTIQTIQVVQQLDFAYFYVA